MLQLKIRREPTQGLTTLGRLFVNEQFFCDTLEPKDRGLISSWTAADVRKTKVRGFTAIPTGIYRVKLSYSPKFSPLGFYRSLGGLIPRLENVNGFSGVLIHCGNTYRDTSGCILVGRRSGTAVFSSRATFTDLMRSYLLPAHKAGTAILLTIVR